LIGGCADWCRRPDANPHANRNNPFLKLTEKIANFYVRLGLFLGLIFLQHHDYGTNSKQHVFLKTMDIRNQADSNQTMEGSF
jgi:hypothetical protein